MSYIPEPENPSLVRRNGVFIDKKIAPSQALRATALK